MRRLLLSLRRDERGAAIIELALAAPVLALMTIGVVDMSNAFSKKLAIEQATQRAIEKVMQTTGDTTVGDTIKSEVADQAGISIDNVTVTYRLECVAADGTVTEKADFDNDECGTGEKQGRYIEIGATDRYQPMFPIHFLGVDADGTYHLNATAGMRTPSWDEDE